MATFEFKVRNVKCGGCVNTIKEGLKQINGVENVEVDIPTGAVSVKHHQASMDDISLKLTEIGFPVVS